MNAPLSLFHSEGEHGPVMQSWERAHRHHKLEPYIGCVFCRDKFVPVAEQRRP